MNMTLLELPMFRYETTGSDQIMKISFNGTFAYKGEYTYSGRSPVERINQVEEQNAFEYKTRVYFSQQTMASLVHAMAMDPDAD